MMNLSTYQLMSEKEGAPDGANSTNPDDIPPPPPITMPAPDLIDPRKEGPTYGGDPKKNKKARKERGKRSHPLDPYEPMKKKKGCGGCCGCVGGFVGLVVLLMIALIVAVGWFGPGRYVFDGYEVVNLEEEQAMITEAPEKPTYYIGQNIEYNAPSTLVSIAILGTEVKVSGYFGKDLGLSGVKVTGTSATTISGDLEVYASEFYDEGITLKGELTGKVMKSLSP